MRHDHSYVVAVIADSLLETRRRRQPVPLVPLPPNADELQDAVEEAEFVAGAVRAELGLRPRGLGWAALVLTLFGIGLGVFIWQLASSQAYRTGERAGHQKGYSVGLSEGISIAQPVRPVEPGTEFAALRALALCRDALAEAQGQARECGLAIDDAHTRGLDLGLRLSREDWKVQPWECNGGISEAAR